MQKINNIILSLAVLLAAAMMTVGCLEKEDGTVARMQGVMIELKVSAGPMTKADPTDMEKTINSLRVYAFQGERLAGYAQVGNVVEGNPFYMDLKLPETGIYDIDFYAVANESQMAYENGVVTLTEDMTKAQLEAVRFTGLTSSSALPMYAQQTNPINVDKVRAAANTEDGHEGHFILLDPVELQMTRSLAKISLYAAKAEGMTTTPQIIRATLLAEGTRRYSYLFPQNDAVLSSIGARLNDRQLSEVLTDVTKTVVPNSADSRIASNYDLIYADAYLPEVEVGSDDWAVSSGNVRELVMKIEYSPSQGGEIRTGYVYMPRIIRNTHYKVCLLINSEGRIIINYEVAPWVDNVMDDLHFDYPTHSYLREMIAATEDEVALTPSAPARMSEISPYVGYFQMTYPGNDSWTPTLEGAHAGDCTVEVYEMDGLTAKTDPVTTRPIPASDKWYKIVVKPNPMKLVAGEEVRLAITYTAAGFDTPEYMLINGSYQEYYWPYEGTSQQDANYVIITMVN